MLGVDFVVELALRSECRTVHAGLRDADTFGAGDVGARAALNYAFEPRAAHRGAGVTPDRR